MTRNKTLTSLLSIVLLMLMPLLPLSAQISQSKLGFGYEFTDNGKIDGPAFSDIYRKNVPERRSINVSPPLREAAKNNLIILKRLSDQQSFKFGQLSFSGKRLRKTCAILTKGLKDERMDLSDFFDFYQIRGEDGKGNVHFTGYFTPMLEARLQPDKEFKYPIYAMPSSNKLPTRQAIDHEKALDGQGLEMAYTRSLLDNYFLSVQGSGLLDFGNGDIRKIGYAGQNGHPYQSIGRILVSAGHIPAESISLRSIRAWFAANPEQMIPTLNKNRSYCFFKWREKSITGGAGVELTPMHSVAVDKKFIPYGACLLAEMPILNNAGKLQGHRRQILFAQDTGGAIRGPGHLDLYHGLGNQAGEKAGDLHHYGRIWLLLAK